jgi:putative ABC transport system substrate-binding protein
MSGRLHRRVLIGAAGGALLAAKAAAQGAATVPVIGVLSPFAQGTSAEWHRSFEAGLQDLGWTSGRNLRIEYRYAMGDTTRLPALMADLLRSSARVVVTEVTEATQAAKKATTTLPIVMVAVGDPVAAGLVSSLARPEGNLTGLSQNIVESSGKRLEMLKLALPSLTEVAVLWISNDDNSVLNWRYLQTLAGPMGLRLKSLLVSSLQEIENALSSGSVGEMRALYVVPGPLFVNNLGRIATLARERRVASVFHLPEFVHAGGLLSYGPDRSDLFRRAASYVDRLLKGARPADLPVEQPNKFDLSVNLATARAIGLALPSLMLLQASELIE